LSIISHKTWCVKRSYLFGCISYSVPTIPLVTSTPPPTETPEPPPPTPTPTPFPEPSETLLPDEDPPFGADREFSTDFGRHSVPYSDILSGGPPKDGIPAIDNPKSISVEEADAWLEPQEPVILVGRGRRTDGKVLSRDTGHTRDYGRNPYGGYDDVNRSPFLYAGPETPDALPAMARVVTVELNDETVAYPYDDLREVRVVNDTVGGVPIVVLWAPGTASARMQAASPGEMTSAQPPPSPASSTGRR
jgi:hypothetical protein